MLSVKIKERIDTLLAENNPGIAQFELQSDVYWLKSVGEEKNNFIRRVSVFLARYKALSFFDTKSTWKSKDRIRHEKQILMYLNQKKFAAPRIVQEGEGYFATMNTGTPLNIVNQKRLKQSTIDDLFTLIADLHHLNIAHGRPTLRDFVIDQDDKLFLLDYEEAIIEPSNQQMARDIYILLMELSDLTSVSERQKKEALLKWRDKASNDVWLQFVKISKFIQNFIFVAHIIRFFKNKNRLSRQVIMTVKLLKKIR